jgi:NADPH-dependent 2,4-dienoyl-CoA reductase/sulfur reductase-like enzyme
MSRLVIIGGSDAGISAALRAKEIEPKIDITVIVADKFPNYSICGLPFYISSEVPDWKKLAHRTVEDIEKQDIRLLLEHRTQTIDPKSKIVSVKDNKGKIFSLKYDKLIIATGAVSARPQITGLDLPGVFLLRWMEDGFLLKSYLDEKKPERAIIIGGGYIGMEMADAFKLRGIDATVIEYFDTLLTTMDPEIGKRVEETLARHGVKAVTKTAVNSIEEKGNCLRVFGSNGFQAEAEVILVASGVRPNVDLALSAGVSLGDFGAIKVNRKMETNIADIYATGDCVETWHRLLQKYVYMPLGSTAHKQGRAAGQNAAGGNAEFQGSLGTQAVKIFDVVAARTGLRDVEANTAGFDPLTIEYEDWDHKVYYPGARRLILRLTGDKRTGRLLGLQMIGPYGAEISKRVDIIAAAISSGMQVNEIGALDLTYTPPLSSPWDPLQSVCQAWMKYFPQKGKFPKVDS